jgi:opacity protein-like surface antigen
MRLKLFPPTSLAVLLVLSTCPIFAQTAPAGFAKTLPLTVGVGFSNYDTGLGNGALAKGSDRLGGGTLWLDYQPGYFARHTGGLAIAVQGRDLHMSEPKDQPFLREDVGSGGLMYRWNRFYMFRPYAEGLMGFGNADFLTQFGFHYHQTRTVTTAGGGAEFDAFHRLWVRADYQYEWWPNFFRSGPAGKQVLSSLHPNGVSVGVTYHFNQAESRY